MTEDQFEKKLGKVNGACAKLVHKLADEVRRTVVVPICKKYRLAFTSGMGTYGFHDDGGFLYRDEALDRGMDDIVVAIDMLDEEIPLRSHSLGQYVDDVKKGGGR